VDNKSHLHQLQLTIIFSKKSKNQKGIGYTLIGLGTAAIAVPIIIWSTKPDFVDSIDSPAGGISIIAGLILIPMGAGFLIASGVNKRKGMSVSLINESVPYFQNGTSRSVPSLSIKIGL